MSTYLELENLAKDPNFLARVTYAIGKFAAYILAEDPAVENHAQRLNWAITAHPAAAQLAQAIAPQLLGNGNIQALLAACEDADIQAEVEAQLNMKLAQPFSYADISACANHPEFKNRVQVAITKFAAYVMGEPASAPNHSSRYRWALQAIANPYVVLQSIIMAVVLDGNVAPSLMGVTDAFLQVAVEAQIASLQLS